MRCVRAKGALCVLMMCMTVMGCSRDDGTSTQDKDQGITFDEMGVDMTRDSSPDAMPDTSPDLDAPDLDIMPDVSPDLPDMAPPRPELLDEQEFASDEAIFAAVDPFIGSGGLGFGYAAMTPAAQMPLGLVKIGPDTTQRGSHGATQHMSGYNFLDDYVRGFSHIHFVGTGVADYGNLRVYPSRTLDRVGKQSWYATQDRTRERAAPGFYGTYLVEPATDVALTATTRGAAHRYTFEGDEPAYIAIDPASSVTDSGVQDVEVSVDAATGDVVGWVRYKGPYVGRRNPFTLHFRATTSVPPDRAFVWDEDGIESSQTTLPAGQSVGGVVLGWDTPPSEPVELRVSVSMVDAEGAAANFAAELPDDVSFEVLRERAEQAWMQRLTRVRVAGGTQTERTIFYTALYNAFRMPTRFDDVDGRYLGLDAGVHTATHPYYTDLSLWDSFRTTHPLYNLVAPDVQRDVLLSLLAMRRDGGTIPRWPAAASYTGGMTGTSADILFGESASKGLEGVDWVEALDAVLVTADGRAPEDALFKGRGGIEGYMNRGYVASEDQGGAASVTLEYAYDDWAVSKLALAADDMPTSERFAARALNYRNVFDPEMLFFRAKTVDGSWVEEFDTEVVEDRSGANFVEGSAWHYRFYALQDIEGLRTLLGGERALGEQLEELFSKSRFGDIIIGRNFLPDVYYWHGNQPPLHSASLFAFTDRPERQAYWLEQIRQRYYDETPAGLPGNDDGGTLSSWYVFQAIGIYPIAGSDTYILGSPIFTRAEVQMGEGVTWTMQAPETAPWHREVASVTHNGTTVQGPRVTHAQLRDGTFVFTMATRPE